MNYSLEYSILDIAEKLLRVPGWCWMGALAFGLFFIALAIKIADMVTDWEISRWGRGAIYAMEKGGQSMRGDAGGVKP